MSFSTRQIKPQSSDSRTDKILFAILAAIDNLTSVTYNAANDTVKVFIVGSTPDSPVTGAATWNVPIPVGFIPSFYKNGTLLTSGVDYTYDNLTNLFTLLLTTFTVGDNYTLIY